jgi:hypothetical protein
MRGLHASSPERIKRGGYYNGEEHLSNKARLGFAQLSDLICSP